MWTERLEVLLGHLRSSNYKELGRRPGIETKYHVIGAAMAHLSIYSEESRMSDCNDLDISLGGRLNHFNAKPVLSILSTHPAAMDLSEIAIFSAVRM